MARMGKTRQEYNRKIIRVLERIVEEYPDWRFGQILINTRVVEPRVDCFFDEPWDTYEEMSKVVNVDEIIKVQPKDNGEHEEDNGQ